MVRISLGGFFEVYETALTGFLPVALVSAGVFQKGHQGLFGLPDLASFAFATFLGLFLGALVASWISDRLGRRPVFKWSVVWYAAASFLMLFQTDAAALCVLRFISAIGVGASIVTIDAYLAEVLPRRLRGKGFAVSKSIQYLAVPAAALMAMAVSHRVFWNISGWRWLLMLPVCSGILIFWVTDKLPESPRWLASRGRASEATAIVGDWEGVCLATGYALAAPKVVASAEPESGSFRELFRAPLLSRTLMIIGATCSGTVAYYGFGNWLPSLLEARHVGVTKSLLYSALIALSYPVAPFLFSWWADATERKTQMIIGSIITTVAGLVFAFQTTGAGWVISGLLVTVGNNLQAYAAHTYRSELFPTRLRARAIGFVYSLDRLVAGVSSYMVGAIFLGLGVEGVLISVAAFSLMSMVILGVFGPATRHDNR
ncbi:MFS transporter [Paraburkholderia silvatlantica]|uniref:MFS transporter n=1 Tax=Paraburkholderia silvatlantica TaxID=321895 RepID=A0ABR6FUW7_9BURK|nr:MFS transporter [Paraburkholderia silvatlantica]MBB2931224.1 putative MFS transporter [Paraburkholderia silvatlantica]